MGSHLNECTTTGQSWERCLQQTEWRQKWIPFSTRNGDELDEWVHWMEDGGVGGSDTDRRMAPYKPFKCLFVHLLCVYVTCVCLVWSHLYIRSPCVHSVRECEYFHSCIFDNANGKFFTFSTFAAAAKRWRLRSTHTMDILQIVPIARLAQSPSPHIVELSM